MKQEPDPRFGIARTIECVGVSVSTCQDFVQAAAENRGSVELAIPSLDTTPSPDTTGSHSGAESGATPNSEQDTTDDEGQLTTGSSDSGPTSDEESPGNSDS